MADLALTFGGDLSFAAGGDLALSTGAQAGQERVLRRLVTTAGAYPWHVAYGAGLPGMVGTPADANRITGIVLRQMRLEAAVLQNPPPVVTVDVQPTGVVTARVAYVDAGSGVTVTAGTSA